MDTNRPASLFMDGALAGRNEWWRYGLALTLFIGGYLGGAFVLITAAGVGHGVLSRLFPDQFSQQFFFDLFDMSKGWPDVPVFSGVLLFASAMGSLIVAIPVLALIVIFIHRRSFGSLLGVDGFDRVAFFTSLAGGVIGLGLFTGIELAFFWDDISFNRRWVDILFYLPVAIFLVPLQVLAEELFFRGYLLQAVSVATKRLWIRVMLPALAFAVLHYSNAEVRNAVLPSLAYYLIFSVYVTWLTTRTGGIAAAAGFHLATNIFAVFIISSSLSAFISPALFYVGEPTLWAVPVEITVVVIIHNFLMKRWRVL